ncbi:hypothetical protein CsSME_00043019 [Camellia sinensis var. sinensis]
MLVAGSLRGLLQQSCLTLAVSLFWLVELLFLNKQVKQGNISLIYHMIRGQGTIKLYVVYNVLEKEQRYEDVAVRRKSKKLIDTVSRYATNVGWHGPGLS